MEERSLHGKWWIPGKESNAQYGVLLIAEDGGLQLELIGGFDLTRYSSDSDGSATILQGELPIPVIHGEYEGKIVTLLQCFALHTRGKWFTGDPSFQRLYAQRLLTNTHLVSGADGVFKSATVRLENFTSWLNSDTHRTRHDRESGVSTGEVLEIPVEAVEVEGWIFEARQTTDLFRQVSTRDKISLVGDATADLFITPPSPTTVERFDEVVLAFMDLLTLAAGEPCGMISIHLFHTSTTPHQLEDGEVLELPIAVESVSRRIHKSEPDRGAATSFRFTCRDLPFQEIVRAWIPIRRSSSSSCSVFFGIQYSPLAYTEMKILSLAIALESFHQARFDSALPMDPDKHRALVSKVNASIDSAEDREFVRQRLANRPTFRQRMLDLAAVPPASALRHAIRDTEIWASDLTKARNGMAHQAGEGLTFDLYQLMQSTSTLFSLVLLEQLGLESGVIERAAERTFDPSLYPPLAE